MGNSSNVNDHLGGDVTTPPTEAVAAQKSTQVEEVVKNRDLFSPEKQPEPETLNHKEITVNVGVDPLREKQLLTKIQTSKLEFVESISEKFYNCNFDEFSQLRSLVLNLKSLKDVEQFYEDFDKLTIQLMKRCAAQNAIGTIANIENFGPIDPQALFEIALLCVEQDAKATVRYIDNLDIPDSKKMQVFLACLQKDPSLVLEKFIQGKIILRDDVDELPDNLTVGQMMSTVQRFFSKNTNSYFQHLFPLLTPPIQEKETDESFEKTLENRLTKISVLAAALTLMEQFFSPAQKQDLVESPLIPTLLNLQSLGLFQWPLIGYVLGLAKTDPSFSSSQIQKLLQSPLMVAICDLPRPDLRWKLIVQALVLSKDEAAVEKIGSQAEAGQWQYLLSMLLQRHCSQGGSKEVADQILEASSHHVFKDGKVHQPLLESLLLLVENETISKSSKDRLLVKLVDLLKEKSIESKAFLTPRQKTSQLGKAEKKALRKEWHLQKEEQKQAKKGNILSFTQGVNHLLALLAMNDVTICEADDTRSLRELMQASFEGLLPLKDPKNGFEAYLKTFGVSRTPGAFIMYAAKLKTLDDKNIVDDLVTFMESVLSRTYLQLRHSSANNPHLQQIGKNYPRAVQQWFQEIPSFGLPDEEAVVVDTEDPIDLLVSGTEVGPTCQKIDGDPELTKGLLGPLLDGKIRMIAVKSEKGPDGKILARAFLKILWDGEKPVLFLERFYYRSGPSERHKQAILEMASRKAKSLGLELVSEDGQGTSYEKPLQSLGGPASFEYSDGSGLRATARGKYTISNTRRVR